MTEEKWLACTRLYPMAEFLHGKAPDRKLRLFACGCCRLIPEYMESRPDREALELTELDVDNPVDEDAFNGIEDEWDIRWYRRDAWDAIERAVESYFNAAENRGKLTELSKEAHDIERDHLARELVTLVRCIFGNPFRPVTFSPEWRTDTTMSLARTMYEAREFSAMPILADALQDAGCDNEDILDHCRNVVQPHVRGCWVVDLVLGKE